MKSILTLLMAILLSSCITVVTYPPRKKHVNSEVKPYLERFKADYKAFYGNTAHRVAKLFESMEAVNVRFEPIFRAGPITGSKILAQCGYDAYDKPEMIIDPEVWKDSSEVQKEILVYHELGHCVLNQDHRDFSVTFGQDVKIKGSIMHPVILREDDYTWYKPYYVQELFTAKKGSYGECNLSKGLQKTGK